jgi:hypothetical protein
VCPILQTRSQASAVVSCTIEQPQIILAVEHLVSPSCKDATCFLQALSGWSIDAHTLIHLTAISFRPLSYAMIRESTSTSRSIKYEPQLTTVAIVLAPPILTDNHLMCTQSGNIQDLAACSGHSPSCIIGSDTEPDSSSRQEYSNPTSLPSDMGLRYMTIPPDDVRYVQPNLHWSFILVLPQPRPAIVI